MSNNFLTLNQVSPSVGIHMHYTCPLDVAHLYHVLIYVIQLLVVRVSASCFN